MKSILVFIIIVLLVFVILFSFLNNKILDTFDENIYLPVSLGEAIDKITILDIKLEKITDKRKDDVQIEYDLLYEKLSKYINQYNDLYQSMKKVNSIIWDQMSIIRDEKTNENTWIKTCKDSIEYNDVRFRIKNKINYASKSGLKEQKGYKITRVIIVINPRIENEEDYVRCVKYISFFYDEIIIVHKENSSLINVFEYDPTIIFTNDISNMEYKKQFIFNEENYDKNAILNLFELNDEKLNSLC
jgi:hypothetical protein